MQDALGGLKIEKEDIRKFSIWDLLIALLIIGVFLGNYLWLSMDQYPVQGHGLLGVIPAAQVYMDLRGMENISKNYDQIFGMYNWLLFYPPLSFLVVVLFYLLFGLQGQMVVMVNSLYITVTLLCVYLIGKNIFNKPTGLLAAFILSSFPGFIGFSHEYWIEFGLMGYVCLNLYFLLKTKLFENRRFSVFLGISLALSFLHKPEFIAFVIGPLLLVVYRSGVLKNIFKIKWSDKAINFVLTLGLGLGLSSFWWGRYGKTILERIFLLIRHNEKNRILNNIPYLQSMFSNESLTYYLRSLYFLLGVVFLTLLFLSLTFIIIKVIQKNKKSLYLLCLSSWFIVPYTIFTFTSSKDTSHILSLLPSLAIIISAGVYFIKGGRFKAALISLIVLYCLSLHLSVFYSSKVSDALRHLTFRWQLRHEGYHPDSPLIPRRERVELAIKEILKFIKSDSTEKEHPVVIVVSEKGAFKNFVFEYYRMIENYQFRIFFYDYPQNLSECDYIILEGDQGESVEKIISGEFFGPDQEREGYKKLFKEGLKGFKLINEYRIANGNETVFIYKKS